MPKIKWIPELWPILCFVRSQSVPIEYFMSTLSNGCWKKWVKNSRGLEGREVTVIFDHQIKICSSFSVSGSCLIWGNCLQRSWDTARTDRIGPTEIVSVYAWTQPDDSKVNSVLIPSRRCRYHSQKWSGRPDKPNASDQKQMKPLLCGENWALHSDTLSHMILVCHSTYFFVRYVLLSDCRQHK